MKTRKEILAEIYNDASLSVPVPTNEAPVNESPEIEAQENSNIVLPLFNLYDHELSFTLKALPLSRIVPIVMQSTDSDKISLHCSVIEHC